METKSFVYDPETYPVLVKDFIKEKGDVNGTFYNLPYFRPNPLHYSIINRSALAVKMLLEAGADPNKTVQSGITPLRRCLQLETNKELLEIIALLLDHGAEVIDADNNGRTIVHQAFEARKTGMVELLLKKLPRGVNPTDRNGLSTFHIACAHGVDSVVRTLLDDGVPINECMDDEKYLRFNGLQFAILDNRKSTVELLLKRGASIHYPHTLGKQLLHLACQCNPEKFCTNYEGLQMEVSEEVEEISRQRQFDLIQLLLNYGVDIDMIRRDCRLPALLTTCIDWRSNTTHLRKPLEYPRERVKIRQRQILQFLIDRGAKLDIRCPGTHKAFFHMLFERHLNEREPVDSEIIKILLKNGVDMNARDDFRRTPLHGVINHTGYLHPVNADNITKDIELLLNYGADINARDKDGLTALARIVEKYFNPYWPHLSKKLVDSKALRALLVHAQRLVSLKLPVDQEIKDYLKNKEKYGDYEPVKKACEEELARMKDVRVFPDTTLFHLLQTGLDGSGHHINEATLQMIMKRCKIAEKYPNYAALFELRVRQKHFRQLAESTLMMITGGELPYLCQEIIFSYLTTFDVKCLGDARNAKRTAEKRTENEPPQKRTRA